MAGKQKRKHCGKAPTQSGALETETCAGINVAWNTTGSLGGATPSGSWNTSTYPANWNGHPCPEGYRLPTDTEFRTLINSSTVSRGGGWSSSDYGYIKFTSGSNSVEFPAVGFRLTDGSLTNAGAYGRYWSSVANGSNTAYFLYFGSSYLLVNNSNDKQSGHSVRCVR